MYIDLLVQSLPGFIQALQSYSLAAKAYGIGFIIIGIGILAMALAFMMSAFFNAAARNPDSVKEIRTMLIIVMAIIDLALIVSLVSVFMLLFN